MNQPIFECVEQDSRLALCHCMANAEVRFFREAFGSFAGKASAAYRVHCSRETEEPSCQASTAWYVDEAAAIAAWNGNTKSDERERLAKAIEAELLTITLKDRGVRVGMALAASLVRRGRALTAKEKWTNLKNALDEYGAEQDDGAALTPKESPPSVEEGA